MTLLWLAIQAEFSTDVFSAEHTASYILRIVQALFGSISQPHLEELNFLIRKSAHFFSYGVLSTLAFFSWRANLPAAVRWTLRWAGLALLVTLAAASLDEFHQSFVPSRTASWHDVLLDMAGACVFQIVIAGLLRRKSPAAATA